MKNLTSLAVKQAALLLLEANNTTTTLEVKNLLRSLGYYAEQSEVSELMTQAANELPLVFTDNGRYRVYTLAPVQAVAQKVSQKIVKTFSPIESYAAHTYTSKSGETVFMFDSKSIIETVGGEVTRMSVGGGKTFYYTQDIRRDLARSAHASVMCMNYDDVRSSSVGL